MNRSPSISAWWALAVAAALLALALLARSMVLTLVALRFANDAEMPELVREVLAGRLVQSKAIKSRVKDWQGDYLRA